MWRTSVLLLIACSDPGPPPSLVSDVRALRAIIHDDPTDAQVEEAEAQAADRRPVAAGDYVEETVLPTARRQLARARAAEVTTSQGGAYARRLRGAYEERVSGLEVYRRYLEGAATDDDLLLESSQHLRDAQIEIIAVDREMDAVTPNE